VAITPFLKHSNKWVFFARAENEYIDMMVEGGAIGFILVLAFLAGIGGLVRRATRARAGGHEASLIGGASFGLIALAVQSGADFAPHVPAVGVFAVVLCGLIVRQGRAAATGPDHMGPRSACMPAGENRWSEEVVSDELFPVSAFTGSSAGGSEQASAFDRRSRAPSILTKLSWSGSVALAALLVSQAGRDAWIERRLEDAGLPSPGTFLTTMGPFEKATGLYPPREVPRIGVMTTLPVFEMAAHELDDYCMVLEEVLRRRPDWSEGYVRLGLAHLGLYRQQTKQEANDHRVESDDIKRAAKALGVSGKSQEMTERVTAPGQQRNRLFAGPVVSHLVSAARCFLEARRCSPFLALPHAELAGLGELLATRDPAITYAARALRLAGYDGPSLAYLAHIAVQAGDRKLAAQCWRKSLEANPASWTEVADTSQAFLSSEEILQDVAAGGGDAIRFADRLYREANDRAVRDRFLEVAIERLSARPDLITAEEVFLTGHALAKLNQSARAGKEMERALAQVPGQAAWREEYIEWLLRWGRPEEAHSQALKGRYFSPESKAISEAVDRTAQVLADGGMSP
jgi:tetratricopeptide (TPR) repeat protein